MEYICIKRLNLDGEAYLPGDMIPEEVFAKGRLQKLKAYGYVSEASGAAIQAETGSLSECIHVTISQKEDGEALAIPVSERCLQEAVNIMRENVPGAVEGIAGETDESTLLFILHVDSRKTVKEAAQKQLTLISPTGQKAATGENSGVSGDNTEER